MKQKLNQTQKNALRLISILRQKDYKLIKFGLIFFFILGASIMYWLSNNNMNSNLSQFETKCELSMIDASILVNSQKQLSPYLKQNIKECSHKIKDFTLLDNDKLCEFIKTKTKANKELSKNEKIRHDYCKEYIRI